MTRWTCLWISHNCCFGVADPGWRPPGSDENNGELCKELASLLPSCFRCPLCSPTLQIITGHAISRFCPASSETSTCFAPRCRVVAQGESGSRSSLSIHDCSLLIISLGNVSSHSLVETSPSPSNSVRAPVKPNTSEP